MLTIRQSALAASAVKSAQYPEEALPEIALFGRSNAGKSSLINTLINRKNLARTSAAPGKTRLLNFYCVQGGLDGAAASWYYVDLPGYGYAKVSKTERAAWLSMMEQYLLSERPRLVWQLVDIRHQPSEQDIAMRRALLELGINPLTIANKADKISKNARGKALKLIAAALDIAPQEIVVFSAVSREGREQLLALTEDFLRDQAGREAE